MEQLLDEALVPRVTVRGRHHGLQRLFQQDTEQELQWLAAATDVPPAPFPSWLLFHCRLLQPPPRYVILSSPMGIHQTCVLATYSSILTIVCHQSYLASHTIHFQLL